MSKSEMRFGFDEMFKKFFNVSREPVHSEILKDFVPCNLYECLKWAADYQNFSTIVDDFTKGVWLAAGFWTDENNRHLLCELEDGEFAILDFFI